MALTDTRIRTAKAAGRPYKLLDGDGLVLVVNPNGSKLWRRRLRVLRAGEWRETMFAIGKYPKVGLADARDAADEAFKLAKQGINPAIHRKAHQARTSVTQAATFRTLALEWLKDRARDWTPTTRRQRRRLLEMHILPKLGDLPAGDVTSPVVKAVLDAIHRTAPAQTAFARQIISGVMGDAIVGMLTDVDPTFVLRHRHRAPRTVHARPLDQKELRPFFAALDDAPGQEQTRIGVRLLFWTLGRGKEVIGARWPEFDLDAATWTVPASRMKNRKEHTVPLPTQATAALRRLKEFTPKRDVLFANAHDPRRPAAHTYLNKAVTRLGFKDFTAHGIRATGSTMLHEMKFRPEIIETQLAHQERNKTKRSYNSAAYLEERRAMMQAWADYLDAAASGARVSPIKGKAAA